MALYTVNDTSKPAGLLREAFYLNSPVLHCYFTHPVFAHRWCIASQRTTGVSFQVPMHCWVRINPAPSLLRNAPPVQYFTQQCEGCFYSPEVHCSATHHRCIITRANARSGQA